jgi:hypothetical protein
MIEPLCQAKRDKAPDCSEYNKRDKHDCHYQPVRVIQSRLSNGVWLGLVAGSTGFGSGQHGRDFS